MRRMNPNLLTVLISASVGVLVSGVITLVGQYLERRARRNELLLTKAIEMAKAGREWRMEAFEKSGKPGLIIDDAFIAEKYFRWLKGLLETGDSKNTKRNNRVRARVPTDAQAQLKEEPPGSLRPSDLHRPRGFCKAESDLGTDADSTSRLIRRGIGLVIEEYKKK